MDAVRVGICARKQHVNGLGEVPWWNVKIRVCGMEVRNFRMRLDIPSAWTKSLLLRD